MDISIHTLTLRVTSAKKASKSSLVDFNPHPHTEGDGSYAVLDMDIIISIHTLTLRVTKKTVSGFKWAWDFNPHPHTEGDVFMEVQSKSRIIFQSTPSH